MRKNIRYSLAHLLVLFIALMLCTGYALAENSYSIPEASFTAVLNEDGSADVTETWTVKYISGDFTRFYKDIRVRSLPEDEGFSAVDHLCVWIDGQECRYTDETQSRPDDHYHTEISGSDMTISAYKKSRGQTRTYTFSYTLKDAVKLVDGDYYLFVYRFVGASFSKSIGRVKIVLTAPDGSKISGLYFSGGNDKMQTTGHELHAGTSSSSGMVKLRAKIVDCVIPGAVKISSQSLSNDISGSVRSGSTGTSSAGRNGTGGIITLLLILGIVVFVILRRDSSRVDIWKEEQKQYISTREFEKDMAELQQCMQLPPEYIAIIMAGGAAALPLVMAVMCSRGKINISRKDNGLEVSGTWQKATELNAAEMKVQLMLQSIAMKKLKA